MIHLILDTNTWIYLCNGFDPKTSLIDEELHFKLSDWLFGKMNQNKCRLYSNYIIRLEWERNKNQTRILIEGYQKEISEKEKYLKGLRKNIELYNTESKKINKEIELIKTKIDKNENHIGQIELILEESFEIPITDEHKLESVELAIHKYPPFHKKMNSFGDAIIFLSMTDFFRRYADYPFDIDNVIFVSNNTDDFCDKKNGMKLYENLQKRIADKPISFRSNLAEVLELGEEIIEDFRLLDEFSKLDIIECQQSCKGGDYYMNDVEFEKNIHVEKNNGIIKLGYCDFCNAIHVECSCFELYSGYGELNINCSCGNIISAKRGYQIDIDDSNNKGYNLKNFNEIFGEEK